MHDAPALVPEPATDAAQPIFIDPTIDTANLAALTRSLLSHAVVAPGANLNAAPGTVAIVDGQAVASPSTLPKSQFDETAFSAKRSERTIQEQGLDAFFSRYSADDANDIMDSKAGFFAAETAALFLDDDGETTPTSVDDVRKQ